MNATPTPALDDAKIDKALATMRRPLAVWGFNLAKMPLGVAAAMECVRALMDTGVTPPCPIEVIATAEEEGRFGGMLGSQALAGAVDPAWLETAVDEDGTRLVDAMTAHGLVPGAYETARRNPDSVKAFLELHIEQGPVLEAEGIPIGIVEGIPESRSAAGRGPCCGEPEA